jgi:hypothetical protein
MTKNTMLTPGLLAVVKHLIRAAEIEAVTSCIETEG